jgi:hypothetical protein
MPVPPVPDSRRFAKHLTGIIHSELMEIPGILSCEMRLVRHHPLTESGPTTAAELDVASVSGSRARIVVYPLPPEGAGLTDEQIEARDISPVIDVESLGLPQVIERTRLALTARAGY